MSLGVQSFEDCDLQSMGRRIDRGRSHKALEASGTCSSPTALIKAVHADTVTVDDVWRKPCAKYRLNMQAESGIDLRTSRQTDGPAHRCELRLLRLVSRCSEIEKKRSLHESPLGGDKAQVGDVFFCTTLFLSLFAHKASVPQGQTGESMPLRNTKDSEDATLGWWSALPHQFFQHWK